MGINQANDEKRNEDYPILVKFSCATMISMDMQSMTWHEIKERSLSFRAATWFVNGDIEPLGENTCIIFVSKTTFEELNTPRTFMPHWIERQGWRCVGGLSTESRNELLQTGMRCWK